MGKILILSVSPVKTEKPRSDSKVSRQYYTLTARDADSPFGKTVTRNIFQDHIENGAKAIWKKGNPAEIALLIGKTIEGEIVNSAVMPYVIENRPASRYTTVVFKGEYAETIFKSQGHAMLAEQAKTAAAPTVDAENPFANN